MLYWILMLMINSNNSLPRFTHNILPSSAKLSSIVQSFHYFSKSPHCVLNKPRWQHLSARTCALGTKKMASFAVTLVSLWPAVCAWQEVLTKWLNETRFLHPRRRRAAELLAQWDCERARSVFPRIVYRHPGVPPHKRGFTALDAPLRNCTHQLCSYIHVGTLLSGRRENWGDERRVCGWIKFQALELKSFAASFQFFFIH